MASSKDYHDFIIESIGLPEDITSRKMMGEYLLYYKGVLFGGIYDNCFLVKNIPAARKLIPNATEKSPYPGAKPMLEIENLEDKKFLTDLIILISSSLFTKKIINKVGGIKAKKKKA